MEDFCTGTLRNFVCYLHRTPQQLCPLSAPEPSGTSSAICTGTLRASAAIRNPPEPYQPSAPEGSGTLRNLPRNLVLQLHQIAPELFWAKDPIASFAVGEKVNQAAGMAKEQKETERKGGKREEKKFVGFVWGECKAILFQPFFRGEHSLLWVFQSNSRAVSPEPAGDARSALTPKAKCVTYIATNSSGDKK